MAGAAYEGAPVKAGARNLITDVAGIKVGNASDPRIKTGATVLTADRPFTAAVHVMGGAPGTRETDLLAPDRLVQEVDALVLSGGSGLGLAAGSGVADALRAQGRGFDIGGQKVPIVPGAIVFDLLNDGDKDWLENPYPALGAAALARAAQDFDLGTAGAGTGATTSGLTGGLGSASTVLASGHTIGALVVVNAIGATTVGDSPHFWAAPFEIGDEFGGLGPASHYPFAFRTKGEVMRGAATTIAVVATDAPLSQAEATRMCTAAHDGMARAIFPSHTPFDGDLVFGAATGTNKDPVDPLMLGHVAATTLARAIARGVYLASVSAHKALPTWADRFGSERFGA